MRIVCSTVLTLLIAVEVSFGQVLEDWDKWVADGIIAEEASDYTEAARLFGEACRVSAAGTLGSERLTEACSSLVRTYLTDRKLPEAIQTAEALATALSGLPDARPVDRVRSWIAVASGYAARGDFEKTNDALNTAVELTKGLQLIDGALAYIEIAAFYMPTAGREFGQQLLTAAAKILNSYPRKSDREYVHAAKRLALASDDYADRREELVRLLTPVVEQAQERSTSETEFNDLWRDRTMISQILEEMLKESGGKREAKRLERLREGWPQAPEPEPDDKVPSEKLRRAQPMYPTAAKSLGIRGTVSLSVEVGIDGHVRGIRVERLVPYGLTSEAIRAVRQWTYKPMLSPLRIQINVAFQM